MYPSQPSTADTRRVHAFSAHARAVVAAFEEAEAAGMASIQLDGYFIDYPIVYKSQRILALAEKLQV